MKLPLGGEAGRQAIGGEREEIKKLPTTPPSALTATSLPSQHIISSGRKEKKHGRCSNNSPIPSLVSLSCLSNAALLCCNKKKPSLLIFKNCQFPLFHIPCTTPALPAKKADSNSYTHRFSIKQRRC